MAMLERSSLAVADYFDEPDIQATATYPHVSPWKPRDITAEVAHLSLPSALQFTDQKKIDWGQFETDASGSFVGLVTPFVQASDYQGVDLPESEDRMTLLSKKYASERVALNREDHARLEMINQEMDLKFPRYSVEDWGILDEAKSLLRELANHSGKNAE